MSQWAGRNQGQESVGTKALQFRTIDDLCPVIYEYASPIWDTDAMTGVFRGAVGQTGVWAARELGVDVTAGLAMVGFDDTPGGAFTNAVLNSVEARRDDKLGLPAVRRLIVGPPNLVVGDLCGAPLRKGGD